VTRKLLALLVAMLLAIGLVVSSASAGPDASGTGVKANGTLKAIAKADVPFAKSTANTAPAAKPAHIDAGPRPLQPARTDKIAPKLASQLATNSQAGQKFDVIVTTNVDPSELQLPGVKMGQTYHRAITGFAAQLTADQIRQLRANPDIAAIGSDEVVHASIDSATKWTGATQARQTYGVTGDGDGWQRGYSKQDSVIAIIDTGIDTGHKDLAGKVIGWQDFINGKAAPYDDNGHGTHVSGIAAGAGIVNPAMKGVAPGAALVGVKVLDQDGSGTFSGVIGGIEWVIDHKDTYNIRVLNMSLGAGGSSDGQDELSQAVNSAVDSGIVAVVAAGNEGPDNYTIGAPAAADKAIAVCAMRDVGELGWSLAPFSSRGPTADGRMKPDICAPGVRISAPMAGTTDRYVRYSGTSMASPFIAGTAALLFAVNPYLTVDDVKEALFSTADDWGTQGQDGDYGYGRVDALKALQQVMGMPGKVAPMVNHATGMNTLADATEDWYYVDVTDTSRPLAATLILTDTMDRYYDLDLYLFDAAGHELASSEGTDRQETINFRAVKPGKYYIQVKAYEGSGPYTLDGSWK
jgi:serine protease AprX